MATLIIASLIGLAVILGLRSFISKKGSCGDCDCQCPVKEEMKGSHSLGQKASKSFKKF
ncbi:FeoB-associated Cys-rich membrane protein [Streptococcus catagoni]|uniref:FeoB-associated Cys-rich membrane protein n=1 Tax=Streptococcus catagoni TaxID=2654874 RepID=UPI00140DFFB8|nr:FeoB-associated Cys-rich membrane protein [Streptococcus catagoni]